MLQWSLSAAALLLIVMGLGRKKTKMTVSTLVSLILIAAIAVGCTFTGPVNETEEPSNSDVTDPVEELVVTIPEPGARARPWKSDDFFRFATDEWLPLSGLPKIPDSEEVACASLTGEDLDAYPWRTVAQQFYSEVWFQYYAPYPGLLVTDMEMMEEIIGPRENLYVFRTELYLLERSDSAQKYVCYSFHRSTLSGWDELSSMGWQDMLSEAEMAEYDTPELIREHGSKYAAALADRFPEYLEEKILSGWKLDLSREALDESQFEIWEDNGQHLYRYAGTDNVITPPDGGITLELPEEWADQVEVIRFKYYSTDNKWILYVTRKAVMEAHKENSNRPEESIGYQDFLFAIFAEPKYESFTADTKMTYMGDDRKYRYFCATSFAQDQEFNDCQLVRSNLIKQIGQEAYDALVGELVVTDEMVMEMVTIGE